MQLAKKGQVKFDNLPKDMDIDDRSKTVWTAKLISMAQMLWFTTNLISRLILRYNISLIEDITASYILCGIVMYCCWWRCPQNIREPWVLRIDTNFTWEHESRRPLRKYTLEGMEIYLTSVILVALIGLHIAAWGYPFPSLVEAWLWRSGSMGLTFGFPSINSMHRHWQYAASRTKRWALRPFISFYVTSRLLLVIIAFTALRKTPRVTHEKPSWTAYWGHIGNQVSKSTAVLAIQPGHSTPLIYGGHSDIT